jgi:hypothetical protein
VDELADVRVVDVEDAHLGSTTVTTRAGGCPHGIEDVDEGQWASRVAAQLPDESAPWTQGREVVPEASTHSHGGSSFPGSVHDGPFAFDEAVCDVPTHEAVVGSGVATRAHRGLDSPTSSEAHVLKDGSSLVVVLIIVLQGSSESICSLLEAFSRETVLFGMHLVTARNLRTDGTGIQIHVVNGLSRGLLLGTASEWSFTGSFKLFLKKSESTPGDFGCVTNAVFRVNRPTVHQVPHDAVGVITGLASSMVQRFTRIVLLVPGM